MTDPNQIGFIGAGNMSRALITGLLVGGIPPSHITIYDVNQDIYQNYHDTPVHFAKTPDELLAKCNLIFLCIKPQNCRDFFDEKPTFKSGTLISSNMAGVSMAYLESMIGSDAKIVRVMPNTAVAVGEGACALCRNDHVTDHEFNIVLNLYAKLGYAAEIPEHLMNAVVSVNASSPAYAYLFMDSLIKGAIEQGIEETIAYDMVLQTLQGALTMMQQSGKTPEELINMVASPGGTTRAALDILEQDNFAQTIKDAMIACTKRAEELSQS